MPRHAIKLRPDGGALRRFESPKIDPALAVALHPSHPALREGRTIFPGAVAGTWDSPRFLVSGHNNPKLGAKVLKGPRAGWPIFHLTLEERATCPRECPIYEGCYGNAMPWARRHTPDADFLGALRAELITLARANSDGLLIRLHTLGDFYSPTYVGFWAEMLDALPAVHVFGYTARSEQDADPDSRETARRIGLLTEHAWDRFAIRSSRRSPGRQASVVVDEDPRLEGVILCPAQSGGTTACASCGLCWAEAARDKTIAFLRHGMKRTTGPRGPYRARTADAPRSKTDEPIGPTGSRLMLALRTGPKTAGELSVITGEASGVIAARMLALQAQALVRRVDGQSGRGFRATYALVEAAHG